MEKKVSPSSATISLCKLCNNLFGTELEAPVIEVFNALELRKGISDTQAELLIRWMWKFEGFCWLLHDPFRTYSHSTTLRNRVLNRLSKGRSEVSLAISLIDKIDPKYGDLPMGVASENKANCIFVSGVFSRVAILVFLTKFAGDIPREYSIYTLDNSISSSTTDARLFHPQTGFSDDTSAVRTTHVVSKLLVRLHDDFAIAQQADGSLYERF